MRSAATFVISRKQVCLLLAMITFLAANACTSARPSGQSFVRVYEMRSDKVRVSFSASNADEYVAWLDRRRVLFRGYDSSGEDQDRQGRTLPRLFVWDIESGNVVRYGSDPIAGSFCYADGYIGYVAYREGERVRLEGALGKEREVYLSPNKQRELNPFTCKLYERSDLPPARHGGAVYPLRTEDGWIERVRGALWTRPIDGPAIRLTIPTLLEGSIHPHKFSDFSKQYLYYHTYRDVYQTWAFSTKGALELLNFPPGPWGRGSVEPIRDGLVLRSRNINVHKQWAPGNAGLYLHRPPSGPRRVAEGVVYAMRVAKDGCRIAFLVDPWDRERRVHRLVAMNLCKEGD